MSNMAAVSKEPLRFWLVNSPGLGAGSSVTNTIGLMSFLNGRIRGNFHSDQDGTLLIEQGNTSTVFDLMFKVCRDLCQPDYQWPFDVILLQPYIRVTFINGVTPSTFLRANVSALPF